MRDRSEFWTGERGCFERDWHLQKVCTDCMTEHFHNHDKGVMK